MHPTLVYKVADEALEPAVEKRYRKTGVFAGLVPRLVQVARARV